MELRNWIQKFSYITAPKYVDWKWLLYNSCTKKTEMRTTNREHSLTTRILNYFSRTVQEKTLSTMNISLQPSIFVLPSLQLTHAIYFSSTACQFATWHKDISAEVFICRLFSVILPSIILHWMRMQVYTSVSRNLFQLQLSQGNNFPQSQNRGMVFLVKNTPSATRRFNASGETWSAFCCGWMCSLEKISFLLFFFLIFEKSSQYPR